MISGHWEKGWASVGNMRIDLTHTGDENRIAAILEEPEGSRMHHWSNIGGVCCPRSRETHVAVGYFSISRPALWVLLCSWFKTTMTTMTTSPTIKLPTHSVAHSVPALKVRTGRDRSGSLVKVEKVGESSLEQDLDQGAYANINAEWVNRKGISGFFTVIVVVSHIWWLQVLGFFTLYSYLRGKLSSTPSQEWPHRSVGLSLICVTCS